MDIKTTTKEVDHSLHSSAAFMSETSLEPATLSYQKAKDLFHAGHQPINPWVRKDGIIEYERGTACVGITPHNEMILLSASNIDDIALDHKFKNAQGEFIHLPESALEKIPVSDRIPGKDILGNGTIYLGQFIREQTWANGDTNYNHILGVAAWTPTPRQLLHSILHDFSRYHRQDLLDSGILIQHSPLSWASKEMVFEAEPQLTFGFSGNRAQQTNEHGEPLYKLNTLTSPRKGWNAAKLHEDNATPSDEKGIWRLRTHFMKALVNSIVDTRDGMTMDEIKSHIEKTYSPTAKKMRQGESPYLLEDGHGDKFKTGNLSWITGKLKQVFSTAVFGLNSISRADLTTGVLLPGALAFGIPAMTEHKPLAALGVAAAAIFMTRFSLLWLTHTRPVFETAEFSDLIHHFWPKGTGHKNIPQQFEIVRPDALRNLRILPGNEIDAMLRTPGNHASTPPAGNMLYMLGMMNEPYGSQAHVFKSGDHYVVRVDEDKKSSGLSVEYWPGLNTAFARNPASNRLPEQLVKDFQSSGKPICMISSQRCDKDKKSLKYTTKYLTQAEYDSIVKDMQRKPGNDIYRAPEKTGYMLDDYPLPIAQKSDHVEKRKWSTGLKSLVGAETLSFAAKTLTRKFH